jgi:hypothetical protein
MEECSATIEVTEKNLGTIVLQKGDVKLVRRKNTLWTDLTLTSRAQERLGLKSPNVRVYEDTEVLRDFFQTEQQPRRFAPTP